MIHYKSVAFDRDVTVNELTHWSLADLETLKAEVMASHQELEDRCFVTFEQEGFVPQPLKDARRFVHAFYLKVLGEYRAKNAEAKEERSRARAELELARAKEISKRHQKHQLKDSRKNYLRTMFIFRILKERYGDEVINAISDEADKLAEAELKREGD
tara:strand:- start:23 stop:496 length:474 start_codon:yes stop_codon:yes gene_type:complete